MGIPSPPTSYWKKDGDPPFPIYVLFLFLILCQGGRRKKKKLAREGGSPPFPIYVLFLCFLIFQLATNFGVLKRPTIPPFTICILFYFLLLCQSPV